MKKLLFIFLVMFSASLVAAQADTSTKHESKFDKAVDTGKQKAKKLYGKTKQEIKESWPKVKKGAEKTYDATKQKTKDSYEKVKKKFE